MPDSRPRVSVCMAAYNGAAHIEEQLDSILGELGPDDEVIIVDDGSTDGTRDILSGVRDPRVAVHFNSANLGYVRNFEKALGLATGDVVMLSDQDDIWLPGRVDTLLAGIRGVDAAVGNCRHFGGTPGFFQRLRVRPEFSGSHWRNILGILVGYRLHWGSAMAVSRGLLAQALPFPAGMKESHDQWLALVANVNGSIRYLDADTVLHRLHDVNLTPKRPRSIGKIAVARLQFAKDLLVAMGRRHRSSQTSSAASATKGLPVGLVPASARDVAAVVSAYNPDPSLADHVQLLLRQLGHVVVVDDGSTKDVADVLAAVEQQGATVLRLGENSGIAAALNSGIRHAREQWGPQWIMTMDQDSLLTDGYVKSALHTFASVPDQESVAAVCAESHNGIPLPTMGADGHREVFDPMQSGTLYRAAAFDHVGYLEAELFIDCVDSEFNARLRRAGLRLLVGEGCDLQHSLGKSRPMKILGWHAHIGPKKLFIYEHAPFRVYYITRNSLVLARRYLSSQPAWVARRVSMEVQSNIVRFVFGPRRLENAVAALAGVKDAFAGRLGRIPATTERAITRLR